MAEYFFVERNVKTVIVTNHVVLEFIFLIIAWKTMHVG